MAFPLMLGSEPLGAVGVTLAGSERFGAGDQRFHEAVSQQLAQALQRVALLEVDRQSADRLQFLAEASEVLSESLVEEETLDKVAHLAVPRFADWATVELVDPDGTPRLVAVAHRDPEMARWARDLREANPPDMSAPTGLPNVLRSGRPELYEDIPDSLLDRIGVGAEGRGLVRRLQLRSVILVPLTRREKVLGVITFVQSESGRRYDRADLEVAEDLGRRAATALENARLYEAEHFGSAWPSCPRRAPDPGRIPRL